MVLVCLTLQAQPTILAILCKLMFKSLTKLLGLFTNNINHFEGIKLVNAKSFIICPKPEINCTRWRPLYAAPTSNRSGDCLLKNLKWENYHTWHMIVFAFFYTILHFVWHFSFDWEHEFLWSPKRLDSHSCKKYIHQFLKNILQYFHFFCQSPLAWINWKHFLVGNRLNNRHLQAFKVQQFFRPTQQCFHTTQQQLFTYRLKYFKYH